MRAPLHSVGVKRFTLGIGLTLACFACGSSGGGNNAQGPAGQAGADAGLDAASGGSAGQPARRGTGGAAGGPGVSADAGAQPAGCGEGFELAAECAACLSESCCEAGAKCADTEQCVPLFNCLRPCPVNDADCLIHCFDQYPSGSAQGASAGIDGCFMQHCPSCKLW